MARGESLYARLDVDFMESFRFQKLPAGARILYLSLWCLSLKERCEFIEQPTTDWLAMHAGLKRHPVKMYVRSLQDACLINVERGYIQVIGIAKKHKQFQWKPSPFGDQSRPKQNQTSDLNRTEQNRTEPNRTEPNRTKRHAIGELKRFDEFWKIYPRKINKQNAIKCWNRIVREKESDPCQLIQCCKHYAISVDGKRLEYIMHPSTFLGPGRRYMDYLESPSGENQSTRPPNSGGDENERPAKDYY